MNDVLSRRASLALVAGVVTLVACERGGVRAAISPDGFTTLDEHSQPLRDDFNRDVGHVRLLFLVDPICPTCLRGLADIDRDLLSKIPRNTTLKTYVVHEPVIGGTARNIAGAAGLLHAPARHYWNPTGSFGRIAGAAYDLHHDGRPVYAWDVWTIYGPDAVWKDAGPPAPLVLMHQLPSLAGDVRFSHLDSKRFASDALSSLTAHSKRVP